MVLNFHNNVIIFQKLFQLIITDFSRNFPYFSAALINAPFSNSVNGTKGCDVMDNTSFFKPDFHIPATRPLTTMVGLNTPLLSGDIFAASCLSTTAPRSL